MRGLAPVAALATLVAACSPGSGDPDLAELRAEADRLVPPASEVVDSSEGACVQVGGNPLCARIWFTDDAPEEERADALVAAARAAGWEIVERGRLQGGTGIELRREGYRAFVAVWADERARPCREGRAERACADELQVIED